MTTIDFSKTVKATLAMRASYICSNPDCRSLTITLAADGTEKVVYRGRTVAICGPLGGARHQPGMSSNQRKAIDNAIFLCTRCAELVNRARGAHYPAELLREWKEQHKKWVRAHLNLRSSTLPLILVPNPGMRGGATAGTRAAISLKK